MSYNFYIYYRVSAEAVEDLRRGIGAMQETIARETGIRGKLLTKADEPLLWMEIYEGIADRVEFARTLTKAFQVKALTDLLPAAARKTEIFREP